MGYGCPCDTGFRRSFMLEGFTVIVGADSCGAGEIERVGHGFGEAACEDEFGACPVLASCVHIRPVPSLNFLAHVDTNPLRWHEIVVLN